jgi:nicotinamide-nucleotide amidase
VWVVNGYDTHSARLAQALRDLMQERSLTLAVLESCTGGLVAHYLTEVPGSGYLLGAGVAYAPETKVRFGVGRDVLEQHGLVSPEVAAELARSAACWFGTTIGLGVTGAAGPDAEDGAPPGTGFAAVWDFKGTTTVVPLQVCGGRAQAKREMATLAISLVLEHVEQSTHFSQAGLEAVV